MLDRRGLEPEGQIGETVVGPVDGRSESPFCGKKASAFTDSYAARGRAQTQQLLAPCDRFGIRILSYGRQ